MLPEWKQIYQDRLTTAQEAVRQSINSGTYVVFGHAVAAPESISRAIYEQRERLEDVRIFHMLYFGEAWHLRPEMQGHVIPVINFLDKASRVSYADRRAEFLPCHFHEVPDLFRLGLYPVEVAAIQLSRPNAEGYCSFGVSNDYTKASTEAARVVIAEVNQQMPFIGGDNLIHVSELDYIVEVDRPLPAFPPAPIGEVEQRIAKHCATLISDGATLQLGIGAIPDAVLQCLEDRKDLGIHTEMFTDGVMHMMRSGQITGQKKTKDIGKVVSTLIMGSKELYDFLDGNESIAMHPVNYTNDPYVIGQQDNLISINSCIEIDLTGQVASETIGLQQFSGTGGQVDFIRGAKRSKGGCAILAFASTAQGGKISRIVPMLSAGTQVTTGRNEVDYVVTEYGCVRLRGLTLRERAEALMSIAHPDFHPMLQAAIEERFYPSQS